MCSDWTTPEKPPFCVRAKNVVCACAEEEASRGVRSRAGARADARPLHRRPCAFTHARATPKHVPSLEQTACRWARSSRRFRRSASTWRRCSTRTSNFKCGTSAGRRASDHTGGVITPTRRYGCSLLRISSRRPRLRGERGRTRRAHWRRRTNVRPFPACFRPCCLARTHT